MPPYMRLGSIARKRHIAHRHEPGYRGEGIYYEEVVTTATQDIKYIAPGLVGAFQGVKTKNLVYSMNTIVNRPSFLFASGSSTRKAPLILGSTAASTCRSM